MSPALSPALSVPEAYKMTGVGIIPEGWALLSLGTSPNFSMDLICQGSSA